MYSSQSKQWNCQANFLLMPPISILQNALYPLSFRIPNPLRIMEVYMFAPSTRPNLEILLDWAQHYKEVPNIQWLLWKQKFTMRTANFVMAFTHTDVIVYKFNKNNIWEARIVDVGNEQNFDQNYLENIETQRNMEFVTRLSLPEVLKFFFA